MKRKLTTSFMRIRKVRLIGFRNYTDQTAEFGPGLNILVGANGQGKTNLLEAVCFLSTTKSHRHASDEEMMKDSAEYFQLDCTTETEDGPSRLSAIIHRKGKTFCVRGEPVRRMSEYVGKLNAVIFSPLDMNLFDSSPTERRRFLDIELGKMSGIYIRFLNQYTQLLKNRNALLKKENPDLQLLDAISEQMVKPQAEIIRKRHHFISQLNATVSEYYRKLSGTKAEIKLEYESMVPYHADDTILQELIQNRQNKTRERDLILRQTNFGIQREDMEFWINNHPVKTYASQGQKRMIIIALKLALVNLIKERTGEYPVLLLDDVLSELDAERRNALIELLPEEVQTIITATEKEAIDQRLWNQARIWKIEKGSAVLWKN